MRVVDGEIDFGAQQAVTPLREWPSVKRQEGGGFGLLSQSRTDPREEKAQEGRGPARFLTRAGGANGLERRARP
jgi:hypothetical protein